MVACANHPLENWLPSFHQCCRSLITTDVAITASTTPGKKKKKAVKDGMHFVAHSPLLASLMSRVQKWQSEAFIPWNWVWKEGGWSGGTVVGCICSAGCRRLGRGEEGQMETLREDTRSQWGLMISFDLVNERKIEVRHRIYWFSLDGPSMARPGQKSQHLV